MAAIIGNGRGRTRDDAGAVPEGTAPATGDRSPRGRTAGAFPAYFCGAMQRVNDSSPNRNAAQLSETESSSNELPGPKVSPSDTL